MCDVCEYGATGKPIIDCKRYIKLEAANKRLKDRLREFADNVLMILENDTTLDLDTKNRLEYEFKQTEQALKAKEK